MIDKATVQRIKDVSDIVEVVSDYVHLTRRGANYLGLCPFHNERTPSFSVNRRRNFCYCFSCHKGGSPVNFIMEKEGVSYHDALLHLAKKYGIKVEERELTDEERKLQTEREGMLVASEWAMKQMESDLTNTPEGRDIGLSYLFTRGVTEEAIRKFHLGYALDKSSHLTDLMLKEGFESDTLRSLGLTGQGQSGHLYDKYRGRVIFPIMNSSGKVVGFGGRDLKGGPAKYINSPESTLYHKNNELYGIYQAKSEIVRQNKCFLVEGYLDVIGMWQSGMQNVVASSGTALTDGQIALIHRFTDNITLLYDGDSAGIKAALRGIDMLLSHKMKVTVLLLPDGDDPDSFARKHTAEEFKEYVKQNETDIIRFKMKVLMKEAGDDPQSIARVVNSVVESLACITSDVERMVYIGEAARVLKVDENTLATAVERARIAVAEKLAAERRQQRAMQDYPDTSTSTSVAANTSDSPSADAKVNVNHPGDDKEQSQTHDDTRLTANERQWVQTLQRRKDYTTHPLYYIEKNIIELIVKYGYLNFVYKDPTSDFSQQDKSDSQEESQEEDGIYTNLDFIMEEMDADKIQFSIPQFDKVFHILYDGIDEYIEDLNNYINKLSNRINEVRKEGRDKIANEFSSIPEIEREERLLEVRIEQMVKDESMDYSRYYPGDKLASLEDDEVRRIANEFINEKYVLSSIYTKNSAPLSESDITNRVIRALTEWKSEILNLELKQLMAKFKQTAGENEEEDMKTLERINQLMHKRSVVAKDIGDRIVSPR